jgi:hypothetical protein
MLNGVCDDRLKLVKDALEGGLGAQDFHNRYVNLKRKKHKPSDESSMILMQLSDWDLGCWQTFK